MKPYKLPQLTFFKEYTNFPSGASGKEPTCQCRRHKRSGLDPWFRKIPWRRKWQPTLIFLHGESHGQRSLVGYSPWDLKESDTTERLNSSSSMLFFSTFCLYKTETFTVPTERDDCVV